MHAYQEAPVRRFTAAASYMQKHGNNQMSINRHAMEYWAAVKIVNCIKGTILKNTVGWARRLTPVIPALWEAKAGE